MHSDRELLESAAKAAGILLCGYSWIGENEDDEECEILEAAFVKSHPEQDLATSGTRSPTTAMRCGWL